MGGVGARDGLRGGLGAQVRSTIGGDGALRWMPAGAFPARTWRGDGARLTGAGAGSVGAAAAEAALAESEARLGACMGLVPGLGVGAADPRRLQWLPVGTVWAVAWSGSI